jgi:hypothetical protein
MNRCTRILLGLFLFFVTMALGSVPAQPANFVAGALVELNDNGAWSWFMDERAIVLDDTFVVGSARLVGPFAASESNPNGGNLEISTYNVSSGTVRKTVLHPHFEQEFLSRDSPRSQPDVLGRRGSDMALWRSSLSGQRRLQPLHALRFRRQGYDPLRCRRRPPAQLR